MKCNIFFACCLLLISCNGDKSTAEDPSQDLTIIDQNYTEALSVASKENKLLLIDFYTTWCMPCKELDKWVFQNDSIQQLLEKDFVLLKYDAEKDTTFHLSKKHHVGSYPTGLVLNKEGYVVNRKYGFPGSDSLTLQKNVMEFTQESIALNKENKILTGYSNEISPSNYPKFYADFVNRTNTKIDDAELSTYFTDTEDKFSEHYFSTLLYFGRSAPASISDFVLSNKQKYLDLYGNTDVEILLYHLVSAKFKVAISKLDRGEYDKAVEFAKTTLSPRWTNDILPGFEEDYLMAQNKWDEVFEINKKRKDNGEFDNGYINHFSWTMYKKCDDQEVVKKCIEWMKEVTDQEPSYAYLDTYAHLLHKAGNKAKTKEIAKLAIEAAKKENQSTKALEDLMAKL